MSDSPTRVSSETQTVYRPARALVLCGLFSLCTFALILATSTSGLSIGAGVETAVYLAALESVLVLVAVPIPRGRLNLSALATQVAGMLLPTGLAAAIGLFGGVWSYSVSPVRRRTPWQVKAGLWSAYA